MSKKRIRLTRLLALLAALTLFAAACSSDDDSTDGAVDTDQTTAAPSDTTDDGGDTDTTAAPATTEAMDDDMGAGQTFVDGGTFVGGPAEHLDPALNTSLNGFQVTSALFDGLTDIDFSDPNNPKTVPLVAESYSSNETADVLTFNIRPDAMFSNGEAITPSTFVNSWERAVDLQGGYSYLFSFIDGGAERLAGEADTITGLVADDAAGTLTVTLDAPYSTFDQVAGFQEFYPMPEEAIAAGADYENQIMIGNGAYAMAQPRNDQEVTLVRNSNWNGDYAGETWPGRIENIIFRVQADPDTSYNAFEAGEADNANIPPARTAQAQADHGTTLDQTVLGSYHFNINSRNPIIGGDENRKLRQAISAAIDREDINAAVYNGARSTSTGIVPPGIPGFEAGLCEFCTYDPELAAQLFQEWKDEGGVQSEPVPIQFNADAGHEPVLAIVLDNLTAVGIEAVADPRVSETYFSSLREGECVICRAGWFADYPTYDNFMFDLYHSDSIGGNNHGFINDEFDQLVTEAKQETDVDKQGELFRSAEDILLNAETYTIPINWYRGTYAFDQERFATFPVVNGIILWEQIQLEG